jgi:hypothetical protein
MASHLRDPIEATPVDRRWLKRLPAQVAWRWQESLDDPKGRGRIKAR